ncbi:MAG: hypothetical protein IJN67_13345 [Oscillospiraceae bacterium]|nr:hypothetical protein [Oscillospiraceae bacterium]
MEQITAGIETITTVVGSVFTLITGNPLLAAFAGAGLLVVGIGVFSAIKGAAR